MKPWLWSLALCSACAAAAPDRAVDEAPAAAASAVDQVAEALLAGHRAERRGDARRLLAASELLARSGARPAGGGEDLARRWRGLAGSEAAAPPPWRGRALGPAYSDGRLAPGGEMALEQIFLGGRKAEVALVPVADAPLLLEVRQADETMICRASAADPPARCNWIPLYTTRHKLKVRNVGAREAAFLIVTN